MIAVSIAGGQNKQAEIISCPTSAPTTTATVGALAIPSPEPSRGQSFAPTASASVTGNNEESIQSIGQGKDNTVKSNESSSTSNSKGTQTRTDHSLYESQSTSQSAAVPENEPISESNPDPLPASTPQPTPAPTPEPTAEPTPQPTAPKQDIAVCNTCGAEMTIDTIVAHGKSHTLNGENFSYYVK